MSTDNPAVKKSLYTPFNIMVGLIFLTGAVLTALRFTKGLGAVTNLSDNNPWGIWISFDLLCGVALAAGGYTTSAACYVFGLKRYHSAVRPAILTAFLGYSLVGLCPALRRGPSLAAALPVHGAIRPHLGALRSGLVRHALPERALHRVVSGRPGMARLQEDPQCHRQDDPGPDHLRSHPLHHAPELAGGPLSHRPLQAAPAVVLELPAGLLLCFEHRRRPVHGHLRGHAVAPLPSRQDGRHLSRRA